MADILSSPPQPKQEGGAILRDWRSVKVGELLSQKQLRFVDLETPVESACQVRNYFLDSVSEVFFRRFFVYLHGEMDWWRGKVGKDRMTS